MLSIFNIYHIHSYFQIQIYISVHYMSRRLVFYKSATPGKSRVDLKRIQDFLGNITVKAIRIVENAMKTACSSVGAIPRAE